MLDLARSESRPRLARRVRLPRIARLGPALLGVLLGILPGIRAAAEPAAPQRAKNVILLISDGCGYHHLEAANLFTHGQSKAQPYEDFPFQAAMSTFSYGKKGKGQPVLGEYDPAAAWSDPEYVMQGATDSAAASTAMSTGCKIHDGVIGLDVNGQELTHLWSLADQAGKATGVVTSVPWTHATPAGFAAHNVSRNNYAEIGQELIERSSLDVIMGCGHPAYDDSGQPVDGKPDYKYVGGPETWSGLVAGTIGGDADGDGRPDPWQLIQTREAFQQLATGPAPKRVCGVARVLKGLQHARAGELGAPFATPQLEQVPSLAEMTAAALNVLDADADGFCLMIEGGAIDLASHSKRLDRMIEEEIAFNHSVATVLDWVQQHSNWEETLVIITGDHETGYLTAPSNGQSPDAAAPLVNHGAGQAPGAEWNSKQHTNSLIPVFAKGPGVGLLEAAADQIDPVRGRYIDNTEIATVMRAVIFGSDD